MEATHNQEAKTSRLNHQTIKLVNRQKIKTISRKQNTDLQDHNHTYVDVRPGIMGMSSKSNIAIIQRSQSKILRMIADEPWYVSNATLHTDLGISSVQDAIKQKSNRHYTKTVTHENPFIRALSASEDGRRLKRNWPIDLK
jgi:hypothetical protein